MILSFYHFKYGLKCLQFHLIFYIITQLLFVLLFITGFGLKSNQQNMQRDSDPFCVSKARIRPVFIPPIHWGSPEKITKSFPFVGVEDRLLTITFCFTLNTEETQCKNMSVFFISTAGVCRKRGTRPLSFSQLVKVKTNPFGLCVFVCVCVPVKWLAPAALWLGMPIMALPMQTLSLSKTRTQGGPAITARYISNRARNVAFS